MKTMFLFAILVFSTAAAAEEPSLFDLSLKGVVIETDLAPPSPAEVALKAGIVVEDVLLRPADRCAPRVSGKGDARLASADCR